MVDVMTLSMCRYAMPQLFETLAAQTRRMGFMHAACGQRVRCKYHAEQQAQAAGAQRQPTIINP